MPFDALSLAAVRQEIEDKYLGGRVQGLVTPGPLTLSLEVYRAGSGRGHILMSAHAQHARLQLTAAHPTRDPNQHSPLLLLLRKYVRGGTIVGVSQLPRERVIALSISKQIGPDKHQEYHSEHDFSYGSPSVDTPEADEKIEDLSVAPTVVQIIVEVMGRHSNIVLVAKDGSIFDSIKRIPPSINRYRTTLPHHGYVAPPAQEKHDPLHATVNSLAYELGKAAAEEPTLPVWRGLVAAYAGVSPALAREVAYRALGNLQTPAIEIVPQVQALQSVLNQLGALFGLEETRAWQPCIAWRGQDEARKALDFAPYPLSYLEVEGATLESYSTLSRAADAYYAAIESYAGHSALRSQVHAELEEARRRDERRLSLLREEWERAQALEQLRRKGEMLLAYMHTISPGDRQLHIPEEKLTIELAPGVTPVEQAQAIFREYRKAQSANEGLPAYIEEAERAVAYLDELQTSLDLAATYEEIRAVQGDVHALRSPANAARQEAAPKGKSPHKRKEQAKLPQPLRAHTRYGAQLFVGRTASQNDAATFRLASPDDLWFHARGVPGSHVILRVGGGVTQEDIREAASYAAGYSKARAEAQVDVLWTERKYVRKVANAPPGFVTYRHEHVIRVAPHPRNEAGKG